MTLQYYQTFPLHKRVQSHAAVVFLFQKWYCLVKLLNNPFFFSFTTKSYRMNPSYHTSSIPKKGGQELEKTQLNPRRCRTKNPQNNADANLEPGISDEKSSHLGHIQTFQKVRRCWWCWQVEGSRWGEDDDDEVDDRWYKVESSRWSTSSEEVEGPLACHLEAPPVAPCSAATAAFFSCFSRIIAASLPVNTRQQDFFSYYGIIKCKQWQNQ